MFTKDELKGLMKLADLLKDTGPKIIKVVKTKKSESFPGKYIAICEVDSYATPYLVMKDYTLHSKEISSESMWFKTKEDAEEYHGNVK